jgi:hypothetical protein
MKILSGINSKQKMTKIILMPFYINKLMPAKIPRNPSKIKSIHSFLESYLSQCN